MAKAIDFKKVTLELTGEEAMQHPTPTRQLPAREAAAKGVLVPYWHEDDDLAITYHLKLALIDRETLDKLVLICRKKAAEINPNPFDTRNGNLDYPVTNKERVGFLRHSALNRTLKNLHQQSGYHSSYDALLHRIEKKGIDVAWRQLELRLSILQLIAAHYPDLALECREQAFKSQLKYEQEGHHHEF